MATEEELDLQAKAFHESLISQNVSASGSNELLCLRVRKVGEIMRPNDVVLFDETFMPIGFATHCGHYYAGQIVTTSMSGKVIYKET